MEEKEERQKSQPKKKYSSFQIVSFALIVLLVLAVIIQIAVIINLKVRTDDLQNKLDRIPTQEVEEESFEAWQAQYIKTIKAK